MLCANKLHVCLIRYVLLTILQEIVVFATSTLTSQALITVSHKYTGSCKRETHEYYTSIC